MCVAHSESEQVIFVPQLHIQVAKVGKVVHERILPIQRLMRLMWLILLLLLLLLKLMLLLLRLGRGKCLHLCEELRRLCTRPRSHACC